MAIQQQLDAAAEKQRAEMAALLGRASTLAGELKKDMSMKIKKIGHCCLVIETKGIRIMTDPGMFTTAQDQEKNIDIVVISHEHGDHFHIESLKNILANNPQAKVITNTAVGKLLDVENIAYEIVEHGTTTTIMDILFEGHGEEHAPIYKEMGLVQNTGFFIDDTLFYPGDAFTIPSMNNSTGKENKPVKILALPVAGPWMKISECIDYALAIKPTYAFPVHDAVLRHPTMMQDMYVPLFAKEDIEFISLNEGDEHIF